MSKQLPNRREQLTVSWWALHLLLQTKDRTERGYATSPQQHIELRKAIDAASRALVSIEANDKLLSDLHNLFVKKQVGKPGALFRKTDATLKREGVDTQTLRVGDNS